MKVRVYAKLNLSLNVYPKQGTFHPIDSVAISVGLCDFVSVKPKKTHDITLRGCTKIPSEQNTAYRAACAFAERFGTNGCDIVIKKHIPIGAGLGGSSADAAAVVACLCYLYGVEKNSAEVFALCAELGSDVNFMLHGGLARMRGKGDDLSFCEDYSQLYFAVTFFAAPLSTAEVYGRFDELGSDGVCCNNDILIERLESFKTHGIGTMFSNGLQPAAESLLPKNVAAEVERYKAFCAEHAFCCQMTGSGSAYFCAFENFEQAKFAAKLLKSEHFKTVAVPYNAWGIETTNMLFKVV